MFTSVHLPYHSLLFIFTVVYDIKMFQTDEKYFEEGDKDEVQWIVI